MQQYLSEFDPWLSSLMGRVPEETINTPESRAYFRKFVSHYRSLSDPLEHPNRAYINVFLSEWQAAWNAMFRGPSHQTSIVFSFVIPSMKNAEPGEQILQEFDRRGDTKLMVISTSSEVSLRLKGAFS